MVTSMIKPPSKAKIPGFSFMKTRTHTGFNIGSITGIRIDSRADTYFTAFEYRI